MTCYKTSDAYGLWRTAATQLGLLRVMRMYGEIAVLLRRYDKSAAYLQRQLGCLEHVLGLGLGQGLGQV